MWLQSTANRPNFTPTSNAQVNRLAAAKRLDMEADKAKRKAVAKPVPPKSKKGPEEHHGEKSWTFKGYDLRALGLPKEALPYDECQYWGEKGYTVTLGRNAAPWSNQCFTLWYTFGIFGHL